MTERHRFATREGVVGAGIDCWLPGSISWLFLGYPLAQLQELLDALIRETELKAISRTPPGQPVRATAADVDSAFGALLSRMSRVPLRARLHPLRKISYRLPDNWPETTVTHFEARITLVNRQWVQETERHLLCYPHSSQTQAIDVGLNAAVNLIRIKAETGSAVLEPDVSAAEQHPLASALQVLLTGLRLRRFGAWLRRFCWTIMTTVGGAGSLWAVAQKTLSDADIDSPGWIALTMFGVGAVVMFARRGGPGPKS